MRKWIFTFSFLIILACAATEAQANPLAASLTGLLGAGGACDALSSTWTPAWANVKAYWKFDEASGAGSVTDSSSGGNTGTPTSVTFGSAGSLNKAATFNGSSSYISMGNGAAINLTGDLTIAMWINPGSTQVQYADIFSKHSTSTAAYVLEQSNTSTNQYTFAWGNGTTFTCNLLANAVTLTANQWQHLVISKSGATVTYYVNALYKNACTGSFSTIGTNTDNLYISRWASGGGRYFNGKIDEMAIWDTSLTAAQVKTLYDRQSCGTN